MMATSNIPPLGQAFGFGIIAGMRSMSAPAFLSDFLVKNPSFALMNKPWRFAQSPQVATGFKVLAATEIIADKLPGTPDRIAPPALLVRILSGAVTGATICKAKGQSEWAGAALGSAGAVIASFGFYFLRKNLSSSTNIPDLGWALAEDALMLTSGLSLNRQPRAIR